MEDNSEFGIFQNQDEVVDNIKEAAEATGAATKGLDALRDGAPKEFLVAKKNCKNCWGRGQVTVIFNEKGLSTSRPEDRSLREKRRTTALCKCVRVKVG